MSSDLYDQLDMMRRERDAALAEVERLRREAGAAWSDGVCVGLEAVPGDGYLTESEIQAIYAGNPYSKQE